MLVTDPIADMLTRIRNAIQVKHENVSVPASNEKRAIAKILLEEGYIVSYEEVEKDNHKNIVIVLKYDETGDSVIQEI